MKFNIGDVLKMKGTGKTMQGKSITILHKEFGVNRYLVEWEDGSQRNYVSSTIARHFDLVKPADKSDPNIAFEIHKHGERSRRERA